ncbi:MAG: class I SAM-dependent methyltransferase, partial [Myxococcota bacterium]|nr:class I SAM-dependent methyltransferase [Myxococcota bacterium]
RTSWNVFFPDTPQRPDLDILVAGCGTRVGFMMAACMPESRVTCVDISQASIHHSEDACRRGGLTNVEHHLLPLEEVGSLNRDFDLIHCHGVLHHLASPEVGLQALASVLRPHGSMTLMVYARYGRAGLYMLQDLSHRLSLGTTQATAEELQELCWLLPQSHPFRGLGYQQGQKIELNEVLDMLAHPRDVSYDVAGIRGLIDAGGVKMHRWLDQGQYTPTVGALRGSRVGLRVAALPFWERSAAMELLRGTIMMHSFVVTHPQRPCAEALFGGDGILNAIPSQAAHISATVDGEKMTVVSHAQPKHLHGDLSVTEEALVIREIFSAFKEGKTLGEILEHQLASGADPALKTWLPDFCRTLYDADVLDLRAPGKSP